MKRRPSATLLHHDRAAHAESAGCSAASSRLGFRPAFLDYATLTIYASRHADGRLAPFHLIDGLPDEVVILRDPSGRVVAVKATVVAGFERNGFFYTRAAAARAAAQWV